MHDRGAVFTRRCEPSAEDGDGGGCEGSCQGPECQGGEGARVGFPRRTCGQPGRPPPLKWLFIEKDPQTGRNGKLWMMSPDVTCNECVTEVVRNLDEEPSCNDNDQLRKRIRSFGDSSKTDLYDTPTFRCPTSFRLQRFDLPQPSDRVSIPPPGPDPQSALGRAR